MFKVYMCVFLPSEALLAMCITPKPRVALHLHVYTEYKLENHAVTYLLCSAKKCFQCWRSRVLFSSICIYGKPVEN